LMAAFDACRRPQMRERASELGGRLRAIDGAELAVRSVERHLPVAALRCSQDPDHLAVLYCETCRARVCEHCGRREHSTHVLHPYGYVDWAASPPHGVVAELGELIGDAAQALQVGLAELLPGRMKPGQGGVVFSDGDAARSAQ